MSIYTKAGDKGETSIIGPKKYSKDSEVFESLGNLDELNAVLGLMYSSRQKKVKAIIEDIQVDLFSLGALIANSKSTKADFQHYVEKVEIIEKTIDEFDAKLPELKNFILPGGSNPASHLHLARAVCRRAERSIVALSNRTEFKHIETCIPYINRLSDLLFVLARFTNYNLGIKDIIWKSKK